MTRPAYRIGYDQRLRTMRIETGEADGVLADFLNVETPNAASVAHLVDQLTVPGRPVDLAFNVFRVAGDAERVTIAEDEVIVPDARTYRIRTPDLIAICKDWCAALSRAADPR